MNQQRQGRGRGNAPRQGAPAPRQDRQQTDNERLQLAQRAEEIMKKVRLHQREIEVVLPSSITFEFFLAVLTTALRHNPDILKCTTASIIQACCKSAYDGLLPDGIQAALVPQNVKVATSPDRWEKQARYNPMVAGLIGQMLSRGMAKKIHATLVYEGEPYRIVRGTNEYIEHEELPEKRGPAMKIRAVYAIAWLPDGSTKFETMSKADVDAVRAVAATGYVWDKNEGEMTRKTVIRRLRKTLPGGAAIPDAEAVTMFPQFERPQAAERSLPAPPRPDRRDFHADQRQLEQEGPSVFFDFDQQTEGVFTREEGEGGSESRRQSEPGGQQAAGGGEKGKSEAESVPKTAENREDQGGGEAGEQQQDAPAAEIPMPTSIQQWQEWADILVAGLEKLPDADAVNGEHDRNRHLIDKAPEEIRKRVIDAMRERITDLVAPAQQQQLDIGGE